MSKKKKYIPKPVKYPLMIRAMHAFKPIEEALDKLLEEGEILEDQFGNYVYKTGYEKYESFEAGLYIYARVSERLAKLRQPEENSFKAVGLKKLRKVLVEKGELSETLILEAKQSMAICSKLISVAKADDLSRIVAEVNSQRIRDKLKKALEKIPGVKT